MKNLKFWIIIIGIIAVLALILSIVALKRGGSVGLSSLSEDLGENVYCKIKCGDGSLPFTERMSRYACDNFCDYNRDVCPPPCTSSSSSIT